MAETGWWPLKSEPQLCQSRFRHANLFSCSPSPGMVTVPYPYCSPSNPSVHGISQARILKRVSIFFSRRSSPPGIQPTCPVSPASQAGFFTTEPSGKPHIVTTPTEKGQCGFCFPYWTPQQYRTLPKLKKKKKKSNLNLIKSLDLIISLSH